MAGATAAFGGLGSVPASYSVMLPTLKRVFGLKTSSSDDLGQQHWTSDGKRYNVKKLYEYAKATRHVTQIKMEDLEYGWKHTDTDEEKGSSEFAARAQKTDTRFPILVVSERGILWIADGNHRYSKAKQAGAKTIPGFILHDSELEDADALEPKERDVARAG